MSQLKATSKLVNQSEPTTGTKNNHTLPLPMSMILYLVIVMCVAICAAAARAGHAVSVAVTRALRRHQVPNPLCCAIRRTHGLIVGSGV